MSEEQLADYVDQTLDREFPDLRRQLRERQAELRLADLIRQRMEQLTTRHDW